MTEPALVFEMRAPAETVATDRLALAFEMRSRSRFRATLDSGRSANVVLLRGTILRGGDKLMTHDGRVVEVTAAPEDLLEARCAGRALARVAYHLGNRHVAVEIGTDGLRFAEDHVLETMVRGLGVQVVRVRAPFEPEAGAYGHSHAPSAAATPRIHDFRHV